MLSRRLRLLWLVGAHLAVIACLGTLVARTHNSSGLQPAAAVFIGIVFSQGCLLGIWASLGMNLWWKRLLCLAAGMTGQGTLLDLCFRTSAGLDNHLVVLAATMLPAGVLLVFRCFRVRICVDTGSRKSVSGIQFSIRQLLILTTAVAVLLTIGKWVIPQLVFETTPFRLAACGFALGAIGLVPVWPVLGTRRRILTSSISVVIAVGLGSCFAWFFFPVRGIVPYWATIASFEALSLVISLQVVRSWGYRLVRLPAADSRNGPGVLSLSTTSVSEQPGGTRTAETD